MHNRKRIIFPIILVSAIIAIAAWYIYQTQFSSDDNLIQASGTVETTEVLVSPEQAGRVLDVMVDKGDFVEAGIPLLQLDPTLLESQRLRALTALGSAQANLSSATAGIEMAQANLTTAEVNVEVAIANSEIELLAARQALDDLYENVEVARSETALAVSAANRSVRDAQYRLDNFSVPTNQQQMTAMEAIAFMKERLDKARDDFEPYKYRSSSDPTREDYKELLEEAQSDYDSAVRRLEYETALEKAQASLDRAMQDLEILQEGPNPDDVDTLEARISAAELAPKQAQAAVEQAKVGVTQAQASLEQAQKAVDKALSELDLIDVQLEKLVVYAPDSGIILSRSVEPGEVVQPGAPVMTLGQLDSLTITVYVPEDRYGQINLNEEARVTVDSFPDETFYATVVYIADEAEFTPRNVQTAEGRRTTVFAVELALDSAEGKLKSGMPADVCFGCQ